MNPSDFTSDKMLDEAIPNSTPMRDYYRGKTIFITGGTGFLGQLYIEKLLRCEVKQIYMLARPKKGKTPAERIQQIFSGHLYSKLSKTNPNYISKIQIMEGDVSNIKLGLSEENLKDIFDNVEIVLHAAADVRFDETLKTLVMINLRGTRELLRLAEWMKKLQVFAYISTAYSHCPRTNIDEQFYPATVDPDEMIKLVEKYSNDPKNVLDNIQERIIKPWPNTYTFTKHLSEELVRRFCGKYPICIIRPTIVISTHEDPISAWCNNIYGLNGVLVACGLGVLRLMPLNRKLVGDIVCADFVTNSTLAAIWATHEDCPFPGNSEKKLDPKEPEIYHVSSSQDRPVTWGCINDRMSELFAEYPAKKMLWKHRPNSTTCPFMEKLLTIYYHIIPGFFFDIMLSMTTQKLRLLPVYRKVQKFLSALKYFMVKEWKFTNNNMKRVLGRMSKEDQEFFPCDVRRYNWMEYSYNYLHGLRLYIGEESLDTLEDARVRYRRLTVAHYVVLCIYYALHTYFFYFVLKHFGFFDYMQDSFKNTALFLEKPSEFNITQ